MKKLLLVLLLALGAAKAQPGNPDIQSQAVDPTNTAPNLLLTKN